MIKKFDVVLCLWNVLGHLPNSLERIKTLKILRQSLTSKGILYLDVNNRHNASAYGKFSIFFRKIIDKFFFNEKRGNSTYIIDIDDKHIKSYGHLFTPREMISLFSAAELNVCLQKSVNYFSGEISNNLSQGQLFYVLESL